MRDGAESVLDRRLTFQFSAIPTAASAGAPNSAASNSTFIISVTTNTSTAASITAFVVGSRAHPGKLTISLGRINAPSIAPTSIVIRSNQEWALDFVCDTLATGRGIRVLAVVDAFTGENLSLEVDTSLSSRRVTRSLESAIERRGKPEAIRCDNGPKLTSRDFLSWCEERKIQLIHIQPGRQMQNGHVESFNGRLRDEC